MVRKLDRQVMAKKKNIKGSLEIVEEGVSILKRNISKVLPLYYTGSLPFVLSFLYFWTDMGHNGYAEEHIVFESLCVAAMFIWMKCWHVIYCRKIDAIIRIHSAPEYTFKQVLRMVSTQTFYSGTAVIILPIAMVVTIPFAWIYAFYQNVSIFDNGERSLKEIFTMAWHGARTWPGQNHVILCVISAFSVFIILNIGITVYYLPELLKMLFGIKTVLSMSGASVFNSTFLIISLGLAYLVIDPLLKSVYTLRSFYITSVKSGDDILTDLLQLKTVGKGLSCMLIFILFTVCSVDLTASENIDSNNDRSVTERTISAEDMGKAIEKVSKQREFAWRMPKEKILTEGEMGPFGRIVKWVRDIINAPIKYIKALLKKWLKNLSVSDGKNQSGGFWKGSAYLVLYLVIAVLLSLLAVILWRRFKNRKPALKVVGESIPAVPDLTDEFVDPVELPAERWLNMGYDLMKEQSFRLALRAFYLAILSHLAHKKLITIAKHKTNFDYILELRRRGHEHRELISIFTGDVRVFDRSWYGMHEVTDADLDGFINDHERMVKLIHG